jgi:hypothetical protein
MYAKQDTCSTSGMESAILDMDGCSLQPDRVGVTRMARPKQTQEQLSQDINSLLSRLDRAQGTDAPELMARIDALLRFRSA